MGVGGGNMQEQAFDRAKKQCIWSMNEIKMQIWEFGAKYQIPIGKPAEGDYWGGKRARRLPLPQKSHNQYRINTVLCKLYNPSLGWVIFAPYSGFFYRGKGLSNLKNSLKPTPPLNIDHCTSCTEGRRVGLLPCNTWKVHRPAHTEQITDNQYKDVIWVLTTMV